MHTQNVTPLSEMDQHANTKFDINMNQLQGV